MNLKNLRSTLITYENTLDQYSDELALGYTYILAQQRLMEARMWTGKLLGLTGEGDNPYKNNGKRVSAADIEPEHDRNELKIDVSAVDGDPTVMTIDTIREMIKARTDEVVDLVAAQVNISEDDLDGNYPKVVEISTAELALIKSLQEARMWLGMTLGVIRDNAVEA